MKVLHILDTSIPVISGYTTRAYYLIKNQPTFGVTPVVLTSERFGSEFEYSEDIEGVTYHRTAKHTGPIRTIPVVSELDEVKCLRKAIGQVAKKERVDLIHAHSPSLTGAACLDYCKKNKIPLVYEIRAFWEDAAVDQGAITEGSIKYKMRRAHETHVVKKADAVIVICGELKKDLIARGIPKEKIHIVQNGVDFKRFNSIPVNNDLKASLKLTNKVIIGFIGSFFNFEGLQDLIHAMKEIATMNENIVLLLVGKGEMDSHLRHLVHSFELHNNVVFTGRVPHEQVNDYYSIVDVLVYPRIKKRITDLVTPLKPLEAMAMKKAVLMSDVGGLRELADVDGVAEFFRAGNIGDLVEKCLFLCRNEKGRIEMGEKARKNIVQHWGWDSRAKTGCELYEKLIH